MIRFICLSSLLLTSCLACSTGLNAGQTVLKFCAADNPATIRAPKPGDYVVAFRQVGSGELFAAHDTRRSVHKGDDLGFTRDDDNNVVAIAGKNEKTIGQFPTIAQYACWYRLPDDYDANRKLRKDARVPGEVTSAGTSLATGIAAGLAVAGAEASLPLAHPDDTGSTPRWVARESNYRINPGHSSPPRVKGIYVPIVSNHPTTVDEPTKE